MSTEDRLRYQVTARNLSRESENKIHDDAVARRFGFSGALVPGVEVFAYACHVLADYWGPAWLERGSTEFRLLKPVYDGNAATVRAVEQAEGLRWTVESGNELCATGDAALRDTLPEPPAVSEWGDVAVLSPRPPADETSLAVGARFVSQPREMSEHRLREYLAGVSEDSPLFVRDRLVHPGLILRLCNFVLADNVVLGPWIHVGSRIQNFSAGHQDEVLTARAHVAANYERKGHRFVELDVVVLADGRRPLAQVHHTAIYRPRQVSAAA